MVNQKKTGRLIAKKRKEMKLTQEKLSVLLGVTPSAVCAWEKGKRYPDAASQEMIHKVMGYNPVELLVGIEMFDDDLKRRIDAHMERIGEEVEVSGIAQDDDGFDVEFDLSDYLVEAGGEDDLRWIPFTDYFNVEPNKDRKPEAPKTPYENEKIYLNMWDSILTIPVEMLVMLGKPDYFNIFRNRKKNTLAIVFRNGEGRDRYNSALLQLAEMAEAESRWKAEHQAEIHARVQMQMMKQQHTWRRILNYENDECPGGKRTAETE